MNKLRRLITKRACVRLTLLLALLLGGAIVNVAVAWACMQQPAMIVGEGVLLNVNQRHPDLDWLRRAGWIASEPRPEVRHNVLIERRANFGAVHFYFNEGKYANGWGTTTLVGRKSSVGWPVRALSGGFSQAGSPTEQQFVVFGSLRVGDAELQSSADEIRFLPFDALWPGFAINTLFYAAILWMLFAAPIALRRRLRVKRGLCPKCAYDLRGQTLASDVCPECGAALVTDQ